jgi:dTDP-4-dehydrorhamnose 3,5-epimerase
MRLQETELQGAWLVESLPVWDERGFFNRVFCAQEFGERGLETRFVQHSISYTRVRGTLRGLHFQRAPHAEVKLVSCLRGAIWDLIVDLRKESPTFGQWRAYELTAENRQQLYIPKGFAHGFQSLADDVEVGYLISAFYVREAAAGFRYNDPAFGIAWPLTPIAVSAKDQTWPDFESTTGGDQQALS